MIIYYLLSPPPPTTTTTITTATTTDTATTTPVIPATVDNFQIPKELQPIVSECLLYLRDRIGVPRDMSIHAARQLRAHINYFVEQHLTV
jgi:hypothetical protein